VTGSRGVALKAGLFLAHAILKTLVSGCWRYEGETQHNARRMSSKTLYPGKLSDEADYSVHCIMSWNEATLRWRNQKLGFTLHQMV